MTLQSDDRKGWHKTKTILSFSLGPLVDQMSHQAFQSLIFVYYFAVMGVGVEVLAWSFIIFAIWDSINDPLIGPISDKTKSKFGRRGFWILISLIPFALINLLLFTSPGAIGAGEIITAVYMIVIIMLYDLFYTIFSSQQLALFSEMFKTEKERANAAKYKNILTVVGLLLGFVLPTVIIGKLAPEGDRTAQDLYPLYLLTGVMLAVLVLVLGYLFYKKGIRERPAEIIKPEDMPNIWQSLKITLKNKAFIIYIVANMFNWLVFKMLTTTVTMYAQFVLETTSTLMLLIAFISAAISFPLIQKLGLKIGMRNSFIVTEIFWICSLIPFYFFNGPASKTAAILMFIPLGIGLAGAMYHTDIIIGSIIDEDEINTGKRREGSYYGINALINRYSTIIVFVLIAVILSGYGWDSYLVSPDINQLSNLESGLKILMVVVNIEAMLIIIVLLILFPLTGERLQKVKDKIKEIRAQQSG